MAAEEHGVSPGEYIAHHLHHFQRDTSLQVPGHVGTADFTVFNIDSIFFSVLIGVLACFFMWRAASKATAGVPGRFQAAVEFLVEMVDSQAKGIVHNATSRKFVAPLALTIFVWIVLLNAMDFLPVDLLPTIWQTASGDHHAFLRVVPTADLSITMGMSVTVLLICFYYNIKIKGFGGWMHELVTAPFGTSKNPVFALLLGVANLFMQLVEYVAKTVSHGMRLFGNMYAGELIFLLIALLGGAVTASAGGLTLGVLHVLLGLAWSIFHILIVVLQAFVFMMLTLVYIGQAHEHH